MSVPVKAVSVGPIKLILTMLEQISVDVWLP